MSNLEPATLELVQETKLWRLLPGCDAGSRLEASGVLAHDGHFHVIFDNVSTIASIDANFAVTPDNCMVGRPDGVYGFEDITYNDRLQRYYTLVEAMPHPDGGFRPQIEEYTGGFDYLETYWVNLILDGFKGRSMVGRFILCNWPVSMKFVIELLSSRSSQFDPVDNNLNAAEQLLIEQYSPCFNVASNRQPTPLPARYAPPGSTITCSRSLGKLIRQADIVLQAERRRASVPVDE